ncbi:Mu transposase C-terminal domain-containing protein [Rummeliibacillus stabekisii]|uniref:Mu transposase C-terminal domain-containing protein n=1 Tax=Rummeliibacillus stabekisii TaxID=241244 RepID=UPI00371A433E
MITLAVNELIKDLVNEKIYRLLWIDEVYDFSYVIDIEDSKGVPKMFKMKEIYEGIVLGTFIKLESPNTEKQLLHKMNEKGLAIRDKAWSIIKDIVKEEPLIYTREWRGEQIEKLVSMNVCTKVTAYKYLRRYWQEGMTINSLLPNYNNSGARGKLREGGDKKRGRPRLSDTEGINVTEEIKAVFRKAIKKYYLSDKKNSFTHAYKMMIKEYFAGDIHFKDGKKYIKILDQNSIPTLAQFKYWYKKEFDINQIIINREGKKKFERDYRAILGSSTYESMGPGTRYQIDATIGNVYLISSYNSDWIIGRPIIYFVVDVFTHMITGLYIGLEGPSWAGMMMAIANATADKKEFCSKYGIEISNEWWPAAHLPEIIVGDRGELEGYNVNSLINGLNVSIENNPSFRPDWKGIVEKLFDTSQEKIKPFLPGYIQADFGERGTEDYRLGAKLTLEQYTKIIINFVLHYNRNFYMRNYSRSTDMIEAKVKPTPIELWKWGIQNRAGRLRKVNPDIVKFYLMPRDKATVTAKGIKFKGMLYSCETAIKESWFVLARKDGTWKVEISFDPRHINNIYLHTKNDSLFEVCSLLDHQERYQDKAIEEIEQLIKKEVQDFKKNEHHLLQEEINFFSNIESIVEESVRVTNQTQTKNIKKAQKTKSIKVNRRVEKSLLREQEAFQIGIGEKNKDTDVIDFESTGKNGVESNRPSIKELFNKRRGKKDE